MSQNNIDSPEVRILSQDPKLIEKLVESLDPSLSGLTMLKLATLYYLVCTPATRLSVLLVGDPGTGKSSLLRTVSRLVDLPITRPQRDPDAFMLVEKIDTLRHFEAYKLESALEESVEQGPSVYATSRPLLGRYNVYQTVAQNLRLPTSVLSLFDLIFLLRDIPDRDQDRKVAEKLLHLEDPRVPPPVEYELLTKYLKTARMKTPRLSTEAKHKLLDYYLMLRTISDENAAIAISPRQLTTLIRVSIARAKLHLRDTVWASDAEAAIRMVSHSLEQVGVDPVDCTYDVDVLYTGRPTVLNSQLIRVVDVFSELEKLHVPVSRIDIEHLLWERYGMTPRTVTSLLRALQRDDIIVETESGHYRRKEWSTGDH